MEKTFEELQEMVNEVNGYNGNLEDLVVLDNDEYGLELLFQGNVDEALRASFFGAYNYLDPYVTLDAYGNLTTYSQHEYEELLADYADEIIEAYDEL